ncbi:metal ion permease [Mucilaginibacter robiniae]|uniref:Metal ion permease n=1 Tax=Mucilaginibacter robiniae TaxID=2728022 RepID=A0A7L5E1I5_9SPHI|nr:permease [Mucilaginibacter robiniae]QJD95414.1 metal ion permease [Mucilaginibacter robiniae]
MQAHFRYAYINASLNPYHEYCYAMLTNTRTLTALLQINFIILLLNFESKTMNELKQIGIALLSMIWDIYWGLAFGFMLSSVIRAFIPTSAISSRLGKDNAKSLSLASFFGAISSSCSYAAASMARTLLIKGATWSNAVAFMVASTNLVFEIFIVIVSILGWSFFGGEVAGGILFILISAFLIARFFPAKVKEEAKSNLQDGPTQQGLQAGHMHDFTEARMQDMHESDIKEPEIPKGFRSKLLLASSHFYMDVLMVGKDILIGVVVASVMMVVMPKSLWNTLFLTDNHTLPHILVVILNIVVGVFVAIISFVCSVGNIVMGAALWHGGISFGGVIAYILADLVTIPMLAVYRSYYGNRPMLLLLLVLSVSIMLSALAVDLGFSLLHMIPQQHTASDMHQKVFAWNYKTVLNIVFMPLSIAYFFIGKKQGGMKM